MYGVRNGTVNKITRKSFPLFVKFEGLLYIIFQKIKHAITTKSIEQQIQDLEKNIIQKTILKTVQAKKLGVFEEDRSSDEEREKESKNVQLLPDEKDYQEVKENKVASGGWNKLRKWATKKQMQKKIIQNILIFQNSYRIIKIKKKDLFKMNMNKHPFMKKWKQNKDKE